MKETMTELDEYKAKFWKRFKKECDDKFINSINKEEKNRIEIGIGMKRVVMILITARNTCRCEIYLNHAKKHMNREVFDSLYAQKNQIETIVDGNLIWELEENRIAQRIKLEKTGLSIQNEKDWDEMINFFKESSAQMEKAFSEPIKIISNRLGY